MARVVRPRRRSPTRRRSPARKMQVRRRAPVRKMQVRRRAPARKMQVRRKAPVRRRQAPQPVPQPAPQPVPQPLPKPASPLPQREYNDVVMDYQTLKLVKGVVRESRITRHMFSADDRVTFGDVRTYISSIDGYPEFSLLVNGLDSDQTTDGTRLTTKFSSAAFNAPLKVEIIKDHFRIIAELQEICASMSVRLSDSGMYRSVLMMKGFVQRMGTMEGQALIDNLSSSFVASNNPLFNRIQTRLTDALSRNESVNRALLREIGTILIESAKQFTTETNNSIDTMNLIEGVRATPGLQYIIG